MKQVQSFTRSQIEASIDVCAALSLFYIHFLMFYLSNYTLQKIANIKLEFHFKAIVGDVRIRFYTNETLRLQIPTLIDNLPSSFAFSTSLVKMVLFLFSSFPLGRHLEPHCAGSRSKTRR
jgi:hypothetical protein